MVAMGTGGGQRRQDGISGMRSVGWGPWGAVGTETGGQYGCAVASSLNVSALGQVLQRATLDATARTASVVQEAMSSIETVRTFAGEEEEERRHGRAAAEVLGLKDRMATERALFILVQRVRQAQGEPR